MTFAQILKKSRQENKLSYNALKKDAGVSAPTLFRYEQGVAYPSVGSLKKLCKRLDLDFKSTYFLIQEEKAPSETKKYFKTLPGKFPELRKTLLTYYYLNNKTGFGEDFYTALEVAEEIVRQPFHFIEKKLIEEIYNFLVKEKGMVRGLDPIKIFTTMEKKDLDKKLKEIYFGWTWNFKSQYIMINFKTKNGNKLNTHNIVFSREWKDKKL